MKRGFVLLALLVISKVTLGLSLNETQNYNFLSQLNPESKGNAGYIMSLREIESSHVANTQHDISSMNIAKDEEPIMKNGNIGVVKDTQMQINPNGVNIKLQY